MKKNEKVLAPFERQVNQDLFYYILGDFYDKLSSYEYEYGEYENDCFIMRMYNYDNPENKPNFIHKASGFELYWYKYPLRDPESNFGISHEQFSSILYDCKNSLSEMIKYDIEKWWEHDEEYWKDLMF